MKLSAEDREAAAAAAAWEDMARCVRVVEDAGWPPVSANTSLGKC